MNALTKWNPTKELSEWNPLRELDEFQNRLTRFFGDGFGLHRRSNGREDMTVAQWAPVVDITEDDKEYLIKAELPEVKKNDVKVRVEDGVLYIFGERNFEKEEKRKRCHRVERAYGAFTRSFALPNDADPNKINAEFKDGVLRVHVAKGLVEPRWKRNQAIRRNYVDKMQIDEVQTREDRVDRDASHPGERLDEG
jgi:HSP20 family protein